MSYDRSDVDPKLDRALRSSLRRSYGVTPEEAARWRDAPLGERIWSVVRQGGPIGEFRMFGVRHPLRYWNDTHPEQKVAATSEVTFPATPMKAPNAPARGAAGRFSGVGHAFDSAAKSVLKKYALLDEGNGADMLAKLFRRSNFGYGRAAPPGGRLMTNQDGGVRWSDASTGGADLGDAYGAGPSPLSGPV